MQVVSKMKLDHPFTRPDSTYHYFRARRSGNALVGGRYTSKHTNAATGEVEFREYADRNEWLLARDTARVAVGKIHQKVGKPHPFCECSFHLSPGGNQ